MILLVVLWVLFFVSHSLLASNQMKAFAERTLGSYFRFYRLGYNLFSLIFLLGIIYILFYRHENVYVFTRSNSSMLIGFLLLLIGSWVMRKAFQNYDLGEFSGIKQLAEKIHKPEKLATGGMNAFVRNPLYFGIIIFVLGFFIYHPTWMDLATLVIIYAYLYIGTVLEEKKLEEVFGDEYRDYKKRTKMLIPYLL